jgi:beta-xylosidase
VKRTLASILGITRPAVILFTALVACLANLNGTRAVASGTVRPQANGAFIFSYFKDNGEDGLHLAFSYDALVWRSIKADKSLLAPVTGRDRLMRDPQIIQGPDGLYRMVWTTSWSEPVIGYATSKDLINWSDQQAILPMASEPNVRNVWAPELFYDGARGQYLLFWSSTIPGRFPETDNSNLNGRNHRIYCTTTSDFRAFSPTRLFYNPGFNVIDATIARDGGRYLMFFKDETRAPAPQKNLHYAVGADPDGPYGPASEAITENSYWAEGPSAIKVGSRWIVYFDKYYDEKIHHHSEHVYGAVASSDLKRWEDISAQLSFPAGTRHGSVLPVSRTVLERLLKL